MQVTDAMVEAAIEGHDRALGVFAIECVTTLERAAYWQKRRQAMRAALEAALNAAGDASLRTNAEFAAALEAFADAFAKRTGPYFNCYDTNDKYCAIAALETARARVAALYIDAMLQGAAVSEPRDVIAREILDTGFDVAKGKESATIFLPESLAQPLADAILAALHEAGYEVVKRGEYIAIKIDPTMPDNTIEVRSDVDSVRRTFLPDETP